VSSSGLSKSAVAGIIAGAVAAVLLICVYLIFFRKKKLPVRYDMMPGEDLGEMTGGESSFE
jgi:TRAP-type C4-dicarboxylate transport system permease large subunit